MHCTSLHALCCALHLSYKETFVPGCALRLINCVILSIYGAHANRLEANTIVSLVTLISLDDLCIGLSDFSRYSQSVAGDRIRIWF